MMKKLVIFLIFLTNLCCVYGSIDFSSIKDSYIVGEEISTTLKVTENVDGQFVLSADIVCLEYNLKYFKIPITLESEKEITVDVKPLKLSVEMLGTCTLDFYINDLFGEEIDLKGTNDFQIVAKPEEVLTETNETIEQTEETQEVIEARETEEEQKEPAVEITEEPQEEKTTHGEENQTKEQETSEDQDTNKLKTILYTILAVIIIIILLYCYLRFRFRNKNRFNRGWKLPPSKL